MTNSSNAPEDARLQVQAEVDDGSLRSADADRYRYVYHAVRVAPLPSPPTDFAWQVERLTRDLAEQAQPEAWLLRLAGLAAAVGSLAALPAAYAAMAKLAAMLQGGPWKLWLATAFGLALAAVIDRMAAHKRDARRTRVT